jgi:hypothetical protein
MEIPIDLANCKAIALDPSNTKTVLVGHYIKMTLGILATSNFKGPWSGLDKFLQ